MEIKIVHLYPDLLNLFGDKGNIAALEKRCLWRDIKASVTEKDNEIIGLYKKNVNLSSFSEMLVLYINRTNDERIKTIIPTINRNELTTEQQIVLDMISAEINESAEEANNEAISE